MHPLALLISSSCSEIGGLVADVEDARSAVALLTGGVIANVVGFIPDKQWAAIMESAGTPCERPGCDCHVHGRELYKQLDLVRQSYQKSMSLDKIHPNERTKN